MSAVSVKICGVREPVALQAALDHGVDMIGLNTFSKSPRYVDLESMRALADTARGLADIVVLTVDAGDDQLAELNETIRPDWWQFHGTEDEERITQVQARFGRPVMKAIGIGSTNDVDRANRLAPIADRILLDAKPPKDASRPGGLGAVFDWSLLDGLDRSKPFMLSGGLTVDSVGDAIAHTHAPGVDVASGVETEPGHKDADLIRRFIDAAKRASTDESTPRQRTSA